MRFSLNRHLRKLKIGCLLLFGCLIGACTASNFSVDPRPQPSSDVPWSMEGGGPARTRATDEHIAPPLSAQDKFVIGGDTALVSPVAVASDMLFADGDHRLHAFGLADGQERWRVDVPGSFLSPAVVDDKVFVRAEAGTEGFLIALNRETGTQLWKFPFPSVGSPYDNVGGHVTSPVIVDGLVIVGAARLMIALDSASGAVVWQFESAKPIVSSATVVDSTVYFADFTHLYAVDLKTGKQQWLFTHDTVTLFFAPLVVGDRVITVNHDTIYALSRSDGHTIWQRSFNDKDVIPAASTAKQLYIKSVNQLWALDVQSGEVIWNYATTNFLSLPALTAEYLYVVTRSDGGSQLRMLQQADGKELWRSEDLQLSNSAPVITNGTVYVRTSNGGIVGYRSQ